jgi:protein phosphatase
VNYKFAHETFVGRREENQDAVLDYQIAEDIFAIGVADGMGGMEGGQIASSLTVKAVKQYLAELNPESILESHLKDIIKECFLAANQALAAKVQEQPGLQGMGTTLSMMILYKDKYAWGNIGDSRIYRVSGQAIDLITIDHTYIQEHYGRYDKEVPLNIQKQYGHYLTKCLDGTHQEPDLFPLDKPYEQIQAPCYFMLCSDGLILDKYDKDYEDYKAIVLTGESLSTRVNDLINYAYRVGSTDNITVVLAETWDQFRPLNGGSKKQKSRWLKYALGIMMLILAAVLVIQGFSYISGTEDSADGEEVITIDWEPLKQSDYNIPLSMDFHFHWKPYPKENVLSEYHLVILLDQRLVTDRVIDKSSFHLPVNSIPLESDKTYTLMVNAILNDSTEIEGNKVSFRVNE